MTILKVGDLVKPRCQPINVGEKGRIDILTLGVVKGFTKTSVHDLVVVLWPDDRELLFRSCDLENMG